MSKCWLVRLYEEDESVFTARVVEQGYMVDRTVMMAMRIMKA